jgi:hypothetical protein
LHIARLTPIGPAAGMHVTWNATATGATFVMFADNGAPIPPTSDITPVEPPAVLAIEVASDSRVLTPPFTSLFVEHLLGSDIAANAVPECPPPPCAIPLDPLPGSLRILSRAVICSEQDCDFNGDGLSDVRDLVLQVRCAVTHVEPCADSAAADCDGNGVLDLDDVLCCAHHLLNLGPCDGCPIDSVTMRPDQEVTVSFGAPVKTSGGIDVPLHIGASDHLGAVKLSLHVPLDHYEVVGVDAGLNSPGWLALQDVAAGEVVLGLVRTQLLIGTAAALGNLDVTLHLALKAGQDPGGEISATAGQFSGPDGVLLSVNMGQPTLNLGGPLRVALSEGRPNPFSSTAELVLSLDHTADVDAKVYDLAGRVVTTIAHSRMAAGDQTLRWDGRGADGTPAGGGVYFVRVRVEGNTVARKLVFMRGN